MLKFDHLALGARDLEKSSETLSEQLGVLPFGGGEHELFGTHNKLWRIETQTYPIYLELLAINPKAAPQRPRWFGLQTPIEGDDIQLLGFVAGTDIIAVAVAQPPFDHKLTPIDVARGDLRWKFGITKDGGLVENGALPYLIEWQDGRHPTDDIAPQGIELLRVGGAMLHQLDLDWPCEVARETTTLFEVQLRGAAGNLLHFVRPPRD